MQVCCSVRDDTDVFRRVLGSYEDRQKMLLSENGDLRSALHDLQKELIEMLHSDSAHLSDKDSTEVYMLNAFYNISLQLRM